MITDLESAIKHYEIEAEVQEKLYRLCPASESKLFYCDGTKDCKAVKKGKNKGCLKCAGEHRQLAEWLKKLRAYEEAEEEINRKMKSGQWSDVVVFGMGKALFIMRKHISEVNADNKGEN